MTINELEKIITEAKLLKSEYVIFKDGSIIGTDQFNTYIRTINNPFDDIRYLSFTVKDVTDMVKFARATDKLAVGPNSILLLDDHDNIVMSVLINDKLKDLHILDTLDKVYALGYNDAVYDLTDNEQFMTANSGRVADGMTMIKLPFKNSYIPITVYGGYIPINKGDKLQGRLYYNELSPTFNMYYEITKKKGNRRIEMYSTYLKL